MVKNLLLFSLMLLSSAVFAQPDLYVASPIVHGEGGVDNDIMVEVEVTNTSNQVVNLIWTRHEVALPTMWKTRVGDFSSTTDITPEDDVVHMNPGESYTIEIHAETFGQEGYAQVELDLYDAENQDRVLGVVKATFESTTSAAKSDAASTEAIRIYPNPTMDYFRIYQSEGVANIEIYNIVGKRIVSFPASTDGQYDVINLQEGIYLVRLLNAQNGVIKTVRLSKN
jgi:hypothetical protein